jgi:antitoxin (DNA-binding transcriptional repressor) of toxin-antitoxin stability system
MTTTMFAKDVENNFGTVLTKLAAGYVIKVLSEKNAPIAMITPLSEEQEVNQEDLFGFGGIIKGMDIPEDKKELRRIHHERLFG